MPVVFRRVTILKYVKEQSFSISDAVYSVLCGDDIPVTVMGNIAPVIEVNVAILAALLCKANLLHEEAVPDYLSYGLDYELKIYHDKTKDAIEELRNDKDMARMLVRDYRSAVRKHDDTIYYYAS